MSYLCKNGSRQLNKHALYNEQFYAKSIIEAQNKAKSFFIEKGQVIKNAKVELGKKITSESVKFADGTWAEWEYDGNEFRFSNDRLGFFPLYYYNYEGNVGVSTSIIDLVAKGVVPLTLDNEAMAVFVRLGYFLNSDTPFKHIRRVPPACKIRWREGEFELSTEGYISSPLIQGVSRASAIKEYGEIFQNTINMMVHNENEKIGVPLSGGRDSRHIALALSQAKTNIHAFLTVNKDDDYLIARNVARELGITQIVLNQKETSRFDMEVRKNYLTSFCSDEHAWILPLSDYINRNKFTVIYDGIAGDILSSGYRLNKNRLNLFQEGKIELLADRLLKGEKNVRSYLPKSLYKQFSRELAVNSLTNELKKHVDTPNPVGQFFFWNRTRREIALVPWSIFDQNISVMAPYLMRDNYDFLTGLPAEFFIGRQFHDRTINRYYDRYSHIPFENKSDTSFSTRSSYKKLIKASKEVSLVKCFIDYISSSYVKEFEGGFMKQVMKFITMYARMRNIRVFIRSMRMTVYLVQLSAYIEKVTPNRKAEESGDGTPS